MKNVNRRLRVRVRVTFLLFYSELAPTNPSCNMLQTLLGRKKYDEAMSDEHPPQQITLPTSKMADKENITGKMTSKKGVRNTVAEVYAIHTRGMQIV